MVKRIISGGQTGADRGGLLAAADLGIERGGVAPKGWQAEDGVIPDEFRVGMEEYAIPGYRARTLANVTRGDGTLILSLGDLPQDSGSMLTARNARKMSKPLLAVQLWGGVTGFLISRVCGWLSVNEICVLNVAGPRESREPGIQEASRLALVQILRHLQYK